MGKQWTFNVDGYAAETSDPYLAELIQHLLRIIKGDKRIIGALLALIEKDVSVASSDGAE